MIKIECGQRIFHFPQSPEEAFKFLQTTETSGKEYTGNNSFRSKIYDRDGSFCYRFGTLKLEDFYIEEGSLKDIEISKNGLSVVVESSVSKEPKYFEKYLVTKIVDGKVTEFDGFLNWMLTPFSNLR